MANRQTNSNSNQTKPSQALCQLATCVAMLQQQQQQQLHQQQQLQKQPANCLAILIAHKLSSF